MERTITPQQLKALHAWFTRAGWDADERHDFIETMTGGRTRSTRELTMREASDLLKRINTDYEERVKSLMQQEARALLRSIYHLSMQISFLNKGFASDTPEGLCLGHAGRPRDEQGEGQPVGPEQDQVPQGHQPHDGERAARREAAARGDREKRREKQ